MHAKACIRWSKYTTANWEKFTLRVFEKVINKSTRNIDQNKAESVDLFRNILNQDP